MVVGIVLVVAVVNVIASVAVRARAGSLAEDLKTQVTSSGETLVLGPVSGIYRGASAPGFSRVKGNAAIALSDVRLVMRKVTGPLIEIPRSSIASVRQDKVFRGSVVAGQSHVIVGVPGGEVGFFVPDPDTWEDALRASISPPG